MERNPYSPDRQAYSTDLTDDQWRSLQACLPKAPNGRTGRTRKYPLREVVNAMFYQLRTGCPWRDLPHDLPPWDTAYDLFRRWRDSGMIECLHDKLSACTITCANERESSKAVRPLLPPPFWIARVSRREKKGAVRHDWLRRQQENQGAAASHNGGHARVSTRRLSSSGRCTRPRRSQRGAVLLPGDISTSVAGLGR